MKFGFVSSTMVFALGFFAQQVQAADLGGSIKDVPYDAPFSWTGFYLGGHLGGAWSEIDKTQVSGSTHYYFPGQSVGLSDEGLFGGFHLGGQFQTGNFVFGAEVSWSDGDLSDTVRAQGPFALNSYEADISDVFTATARLGYAVDRWLGYVKGGYATADIDTSATEVPAFNHTGTSSERHDGWTVGGGIEYAVTNSIIVGVEYNYVDLDAEVHALNDNAPQGASPERVSVDPDSISSVVGRFSLKF